MAFRVENVTTLPSNPQQELQINYYQETTSLVKVGSVRTLSASPVELLRPCAQKFWESGWQPVFPSMGLVKGQSLLTWLLRVPPSSRL